MDSRIPRPETAAERGEREQGEGVKITENPYPKGLKDFKRWNTGWWIGRHKNAPRT